MPFLKDDGQIDLTQRADAPKGFAVTPGAADLEDGPAKPSWNWGAAFRRNNEMAALVSSESVRTGNEPESGFNPWDKVKGTPDEVNFRQLSEARNQIRFYAIKADIARETEDRKLLDSQPWWMGLVTEGTAGILSPTSLLPGGTFVKGAKGGISLLKAGASVGVATGASVAAQEAMLQGIEQTRTAGESAMAIGASTFLGGLLGAGGQALLSKADWQKGVAALDNDVAAAGYPKLPQPDTFNIPRQPTAEEMAAFGRVESVPLNKVFGTETKRQWDRFNSGDHPGDLITGYGDKPVAVKLSNGEFLVYDGHHRTELALKNGASISDMHVIDAKDFAPGADKKPPNSSEISDDELLRELTGGGSLKSMGAAANTATDLADNTIAGRAASGVAAATARMNPLLRALHSPSAAYREIATDLVENPLYLKKNFEGVASQPAVETLMKEYNSGLAKALQATNDAYPEYRKAGGQLGKDEFREAVGKAMRRGDADADPFVTKIAQEYRAKVFDPLKEQAIKAGLLPKDVSVDTAQSYFTRMWNSRKISADEQGFKEMVREHVGRQLQDEFSTSVEAHARRIARLQQEAADLQLTPEQRVTEAANVQQQLDKLDSLPIAEMADQLSELNKQTIKARKAGDPASVKLLKEQADALKKEGGDEFKQFLAGRAALRSRQKNIEFGAAGLQERHDRVLGQLNDLEEANFREMERLVKKGQKLERDLDRLDADAFEARINQLITSYSGIARKAEASAERAQKTIDNIKEEASRRQERFITEAQRAATEALTGPPEEVAAKKAAAREAREKVKAIQDARDAATKARFEKEAERQAALAERMDKISQRLEIAKNFDHDGLMDEIKRAIDQATRETSARSLARGERAVRLGERAAQFDPAKAVERAKLLDQMRIEAEAKFIDRWEVGRGAIDVDPAKRQAKFDEAAKQIADEVFDTLSGRVGLGNRPEFITIKSRGPMKERTFHIPDLFQSSNGRAVEDYLEHDVEQVARRYTRIMGADVELARKFGSVDMADQITKIRDDYRNLRAGITDEKQLTKLADREKNDIADLEAVRDMLRGTNPGASVDANYSRIVRAVNHINYLRSMGEVAIASLSETVRPAMVHGLMPYMETLGQTLTNLKAIKASVKEAQIAGTVTERVLGTRLATLSEIIDPYASRGPVEAFLENMTNFASRWNGIRLLTDMQKSIAAVMTQNRLLGNVTSFKEISPKERAYLAYLGIDQGMAERIAKQFADHGETVDKVHVANQEKWTDEVAARTYRAAISKDVDSIITTKGVADTPLFANTPTGRAMLQFKSFALASHQRVLLRGLQEGQARFVGGLIAMTTIGMMATWMKAVSGNRTEKLQDIGKNPGWWIAEGFDRAGIFAVPTELANTFEKATGFNPIKTPMKAFDEGAAISQKNQNRSLLGSIAGPSAGLIDDASSVAGLPQKMLMGEEITQGQKNAAERLFPFNSYVGIRQMLRYVVNPQQ